MTKKIFVFDPTESDKLSSVRGVGSYLQLLKENFKNEFHFINFTNFKNFKNSVFINPFFNFLQPPLTLRRLAKKQVAVIHDLITLKYPSHFPAGVRGNINIFLNRLALRNYDLIITDSKASKKDIIDILGLPEGKIKVIYPCLPKAFLNTPSVIARSETTKQSQNKKEIAALPSVARNDIGEKYCLYVGDATWNKNLVNLAKAIKIINVTCVFVGKVFEPKKTVSSDHPWQREFKQFLEEVKDDKRFIFSGFVPDSQLLKFYQQAKLNVLPSSAEGFGFSYLEAGSQSCPSVLSDIPVLKEIAGGNALFADPKNPNDIADKIGEIYFNKDVGNKLGGKAKKRSEFFTPEKFRKEFLRCL